MVFLLCFFLVADVSYGINKDCLLPKVVGFCRARFPRYYYNSSSRRCEKFIYGGCGGNANNFSSYYECHIKCFGPRAIIFPEDSPKEN
uniref:U-actitoxin-Avd3n n=1 Tax=Anemonia viridis TaxID=51769 RepID=VKTB_ANEVI|nr:RecName: Full=U-actitoxin-Avd3n; Short=U-AITX-Avd3n; AltName: Full=AsKC11; Flags: Precursor [Anemonia viridis]